MMSAQCCGKCQAYRPYKKDNCGGYCVEAKLPVEYAFGANCDVFKSKKVYIQTEHDRKPATVSQHPTDSKGRHLYYSFLAEKFDWERFISDFYADDLKWAVIEKPTKITFVTRDLEFYNHICQQLHNNVDGFSGMLYSYQQLEIDRQKIICWNYTKDKLRPLLKILRAKNKKRFSVHCGYEND